MGKFKENLYSDNIHNYDYDDLIKDKLADEIIDQDQDIDNKYIDKKHRSMPYDPYANCPRYKRLD